MHYLKLNKHKNHYLQEDFNKYKLDNFNFIILEDNLTLSDRRDRETYWINYFGGIESENVYNFQDNITENLEMRILVSQNQKGKIISSESIEKMRKSLTGRTLSVEHREHIKQSCSKFIGDNNPAKRPEVRKKISEKISGKNNGMYGKRKYTQEVIDVLREEHINGSTYKSIAYKYGISKSVVANLIRFGETYNPTLYLPKRKFND